MLMNIFFLFVFLKFNEQRFLANRENSYFDELDDKLFVDLYAIGACS